MTLGISDISVLKDGFSIAPEYLMKKINAVSRLLEIFSPSTKLFVRMVQGKQL